MGIIKEEIEYNGIYVTILEKTKGEVADPGKIIDFDIDRYSRTPKELVQIGEWLIDQGTRIEKEYTPNGRKKKHI